jgi:DnaK suppressor protein
MSRAGKDPQQLDRARGLLERERQRHLALRTILVDQLARERETAPGSDLRTGTNGEDRVLLARLVERHVSALAGIRAAFERLHDGTYGRCQRCGQSIGRDRLEALPASTQCLACQERPTAGLGPARRRLARDRPRGRTPRTA